MLKIARVLVNTKMDKKYRWKDIWGKGYEL